MSNAKRPSFQWYPGDFHRDAAVRSCVFEVRALWREMLDLMHDGEPYGHLTAGGVSTEPDLPRLVGKPARIVSKWLAELEAKKVFSRTPSGIIYSRRMVRDEHIRNVRAAAGKLGGNPDLLVNQNPTIDATKTQPLHLQSSSASATGEPADKKRGANNTAGEASLLVDRIRKLAIEIPGHGKRIQRTAVEAMGADVLAAYEAIGGSDRILTATGREVSFVNREFASALAAARAA